VVISHNDIAGVECILLVPNYANQVYLSDTFDHRIYLWIFEASSPTVTLSQVSGSTSSLNYPLGMTLDRYHDLYVADKDNDRIAMYPMNSTIGIPVVEKMGKGAVFGKPMDIAFDFKMNMYVVCEENRVIKFFRT
jgi:hypothetical protein